MKKLIATLGAMTLICSGCGGNAGGDGDLGMQIDQMGRPAINTALINTFAADKARAESEDEYNSTGNDDRFEFTDTMAFQLGVYDSLAGVCGDNPLTNRKSTDPADGLATGADRYKFVASVFADDQLYVNSASAGAAGGQCNQYFSAELGVLGVTGLETDCGGRTPLYDVIETTYSAVALGAVKGVDDGVKSDNVAQSATQFPFLAAPF